MLCNRAEFQTGQDLVPVLKRSELRLLLIFHLIFMSFTILFSLIFYH